jgi:hypothetical protein
MIASTQYGTFSPPDCMTPSRKSKLYRDDKIGIIATGYGKGAWGLNPDNAKNISFFSISRLALGPTHPMGTGDNFPGR